MALMGKEMNKLTNINWNGRNYANRRKYFGEKNQEYNG